MSKKKTIILQLNEVNFDLVSKYIDKGYLKNFDYFLKNFNFLETISENKYENLEPWIQWVSFYSGKEFKDHKVFYLNEYKKEEWNFFKVLEKKFKKKLALFFPMNLKNDFSRDTFFLPDPWTETDINADYILKKIFSIFKRIILENSSNKISVFDYFILTLFTLFKTSFKFKIFILKNVFKIKKFKFFKALIFDRLCWEIFKENKSRKNSDISSLFLNGCAHIQHHYLLNSKVVESETKNPEWYLSNIDPVLECLTAYDNILGEIKNFKNTDILILTGLSQTVIDKPIFYYNLTQPENFFKNIDINYQKIIKRMSRDYTLSFNSKIDFENAKKKLSNIKLNHQEFFSFQEHENKLYVELKYSKQILKSDLLNVNDNCTLPVFEHVNFVAIKNSIHNQKGYLISSFGEFSQNIAIHEVHKVILNKYK